MSRSGALAVRAGPLYRTRLVPLTTATLLSNLDPGVRAQLRELEGRARMTGASAEQLALAQALVLALNSPRTHERAGRENEDVTTNE
jgi:hypothetical protein